MGRISDIVLDDGERVETNGCPLTAEVACCIADSHGCLSYDGTDKHRYHWCQEVEENND